MMSADQEDPVTVDMYRAHAIQPELASLRQQLHKHPELGFEVEESASLVKQSLESLGVSVQSGVGRCGVVGLIEGAKSRPVVALRAELDALPIQEHSDIPYASQVSGVMHACGHDLHTACLIGAANLLMSLREAIPGTVKLIFQPGEEIDAGAREMIADGVLEKPQVDAVFGIHNYPGLSTGCIAVTGGSLMAAIDTFRIEIEGQEGHGAVPHLTVDALVSAASIVLELQTVVSRNISPLKPAVVSIGTFHAGTANNVIAGKAEITGTARALDSSVQSALFQHIERVVRHGSEAFGASAALEYRKVVPAVVNDDHLADLVVRAAMRLLGSESVLSAETTMAGDDFALYLESVPGCYIWLGATNPNGPSFGWHHPCFDVDEGAIPVGCAVLAQAALDFLQVEGD